ncbi:polysaccharide deacetylase family protein [Actinoplanes sp. Pm04-4]|uniref:Polysaccharide deacetylase family protein n=1 Tax=Paractinoplanes pyxinae TaxID=2997416 RepID=A0ABT4B3U7_9ACTN|nr:polysaccharide deacetylase family protein [Actinoplanes pyxinae]MCY1140560.1 polysaccharide deacetylase family protein [Actinoplanes pyxinae]
MSPQSPRIPTQGHASAISSTGRHRRPESLADVSVRSGPRVSMTSLETTVPAPRAPRHSQPVRGGRHAVARPTPGTHRAPGTLPIESWILMGKTRQGALLASLVAIGIVLLAMPAEQRRDGFDAVNAAAQAVAGVQTEKKAPRPAAPPPAAESADSGDSDGSARDDDDKAPAEDKDASAPEKAQPTASAPATPEAPATEAAEKPKQPAAGPGQSLRTTGSEVVALTFDDGPDPVQTPKILQLLGQYDVKATFCLVGAQVKRHPDIVRQIVAEGHTLCNHTWDHSLTIGKDEPAKIKADLDRTNAAILAAVPTAKIPFFRAPGGNFTDRLVGVAGTAGMTSLYWQVDPRDWDHPEKETEPQHIARVVKDVREQVRPGSIVLSHDFNQPATIAAYEELLPYLAEKFTLGIPSPAEETPTPSAPPATPPADS